MAVYTIGKLIKETRERLHISQEELCGVVIAVSTLSKIENGKAAPSKKVREYLCQKLGLSNQLMAGEVTEVEMKRAEIECEVYNRLARQQYDYASLLEQYDGYREDYSILDKQFYLFGKAILYHNETNAHDLSESKFIAALNLTLPSFSIGMSLCNHYFSTLELLLINNIAICHYSSNKEEAMHMMRELKDYFETKGMDISEKAKHYPAILYNLQNWEGYAVYRLH